MSTDSSAKKRQTRTQQTIKNAEIAIAFGPNDGDACSYCTRKGVPILPLRYAIVPGYLGRGGLRDPSTHPGTKLGDRSATAAEKRLLALKANRYTLRTLRSGFLMVYFGEQQWDAYAVDPQGLLKQIPRTSLDNPSLSDTYLDVLDADPGERKDNAFPKACRREGHNIAASFIHIPEVVLGTTRAVPQKFWIAFTAVPWTASVRRHYEGSGEAARRRRAARMQAFDTRLLQSNADAVDDAFSLADAETGEQRLGELVFEMAADEQEARSRDTVIGNDPTQLKQPHPAPRQWVSTHGVAMRLRERRQIAKYAAEYKIDGTKHHGSAIVLHDPIGITQEANHHRMEHLLFDAAFAADADVHHRTVISAAIVSLREGLQAATAKALTQEECEKGLPDVQSEPRYDKFDPIVTTTRAQRIDRRFKDIWDEMLPHYREQERADFDTHTRKVRANSHALHLEAASDYDLWLDDPRWQALAEDFDATSIAQQAALHHEWNSVLEGGPTETKTAATWERFLDLDFEDKTNPLARALFGAHRSWYDFMVPELTLEMKGPPDKAGKLYFVLRALIATPISSDGWEELMAKVSARQKVFTVENMNRPPGNLKPNPLRPIAGRLKKDFFKFFSMASVRRSARKVFTALAAALARVSPILATPVLKLMQVAELLYDRVETCFLTMRMNDQQYAAYIAARRSASTSTSAIAKGRGNVSASPPEQPIRFDGEIDVTLHVSRPISPDEMAPDASTLGAAAGNFNVHPATLNPTPAWARRILRAERDANRIFRSGVGLYGLGQFFFGLWALKATLEDANNRVIASNEARVMVGAGSLAAIGGGLETVAASAKVLGRGTQWTGALTKLSIEFVVLSVTVEGVANTMVTRRLAAEGDFDAAALYGISAGLMFTSAALIGVGTLWFGELAGPLLFGLGFTGWGLILVVLAYFILMYFAESAVDTPLQIWLDRCAWGRHKRWIDSGYKVQQRPWGPKDIGQETNHLNAIVWGMTADMGFDDAPFMFMLPLPTSIPIPVPRPLDQDSITFRLALPNFKDGISQCAWRLQGISTDGRRVTIAQDRTPGFVSPEIGPEPPGRSSASDLIVAVDGPTETSPLSGKAGSPACDTSPTPSSSTMKIVTVRAEVRTAMTQLSLVVDYVPDSGHPATRAVIQSIVED